MRKHDVRKWLHAVLDLLPVILIPVFMIYSHRHDVTQDFVVTEQVPVYYQTNEVNSLNDLTIGNVYRWEDNYVPSYVPTSYENLFNIEKTDNLRTYVPSNLNFDELHDFGLVLIVNSGNLVCQYFDATNTNRTFGLNSKVLDFVISSFGGQFNSTSYILSHISSSDALFLKEYQVVTTEIPKDVMTSFMDRFNTTIDNYFNMGNVFNLNGVYEWFNTNIFSGNAPSIIYSIWNIALYELVMDLLFLLYGLFMWFIDMVEHLMEKPFKSIK